MKDEMTPQESMSIIQEMIAQAKDSFDRISPYFLLWGFLLLPAGLLEFFLKQQGVENFWVGWPIAGVLGGLIATFIGIRQANSGPTVETLAGRVFKYLWMGFVILLLCVLYATLSRGIDPNPFVLMITGLPTFVTGATARFKPLMVGGLLFWVFALLALHVDPLYTGLVFSLAILCAYLIPGILLMRKENGVRTT